VLSRFHRIPEHDGRTDRRRVDVLPDVSSIVHPVATPMPSNKQFCLPCGHGLIVDVWLIQQLSRSILIRCLKALPYGTCFTEIRQVYLQKLPIQLQNQNRYCRLLTELAISATTAITQTSQSTQETESMAFLIDSVHKIDISLWTASRRWQKSITCFD